MPNTSMVAERTDDYDQRTSMLSFRYFFGWYWGLTMAALAFISRCDISRSGHESHLEILADRRD